MSDTNQGLSIAVRALDELPEQQRVVYRARYVDEESREDTCIRLGMAPERYDELLKETMFSLRRMIASAPRQLARA